MKYCFDIDGTICHNTFGSYEEARPLPEMIDRIRSLHQSGHQIILFTARGSTTGLDWRNLTERQMAEWNVPYHQLIFGKPEADLYIDDKAINAAEWMKTPLPEPER